MTDRDKLISLCHAGLEKAGWSPADYEEQLHDELREIEAQNEYEYFLDIVNKKVKYKNENNLLVPRLLGIVDDYNPKEKPQYIHGELPDIDIDYLPDVRDYLKNVWAPREYGADKVCSIGSYNSFGIKSALIDMARVHGESRSEILELTTKLGLKDDDGKALTWDKALEEYPDLKAYCEAKPEVARAAKKILNRNRGMGKHAGGLIISSLPIANFVPLVKDKSDTQLSAWVEGLHGQDLGPVGLVKFDLLVITNLMQIAKACKLIKERHGLKSICAKPGNKDWSDTSYLKDTKAIDMAARGDLKCIFQFDSEGIRAMAKAGGVDNFEDLVAYSALYRPGPLGMKMQERYIERKHGREEFPMHHSITPFMAKTYNVLVYQEQVMQMLHVVGGIPLKDCETIRKAISKKNEAYFGKYREQFIRNGQIILGQTEEELKYLWDQIAAFAEYGFNRSHAVAYTMISARLLYLKANFPLEFFTAVLSCEGSSDKIKEYKVEASRQNIGVNKLSLNDSRVLFDIVGGKLNFGFANVKGVGTEVAERIVANQPYTGIQDFLERFGTDANVVKPLIALGCFEGDPLRLWLYSEHYKDKSKKVQERKKRFQASQVKYQDELKAVVSSDDFERMKDDFLKVNLDDWYRCQSPDGEDESNALDVTHSYLVKLQKKWKRSIDGNVRKSQDTESGPVPFDQFTPESFEVDSDLDKLLCNKEEAEKQFYGFIWTHPLEKSPDFKGGHTFEAFRLDAEARGVRAAMCEVQIVSVEIRTTKSGNPFASLRVEDANSEPGFVNVWSEDLDRFRPELQPGNLVKMRVLRPDPPFRNYTFESPPRHKRATMVPKNKGQDYRLVMMKKAEVETRRPLNDEEIEAVFPTDLEEHDD